MHIFDITFPPSWKHAVMEFFNFYIYFFIVFLLIIDYIVHHVVGRERTIWFFVSLYEVFVIIRTKAIPFYYQEFKEKSIPWTITTFLKLINSPYHQIYLDNIKKRAEEEAIILEPINAAATAYYVKSQKDFRVETVLEHFIQTYIAPYHHYTFFANLFAVPTWFFYYDTNSIILNETKSYLQYADTEEDDDESDRENFRVIISHMLPFLTGETLTYTYQIIFEQRVIEATLLTAEYKEAVIPVKPAAPGSLLALGGTQSSEAASIITENV